MGRRALPPELKRQALKVYVNGGERDEIEFEATREGRTVSEWVSDAALRRARLLRRRRETGDVLRTADELGVGMSDEARAAIDHYIETHPRGRHGKVVYDLEGDFGITRDAMYEVFANYMEAFPVQRETPNA